MSPTFAQNTSAVGNLPSKGEVEDLDGSAQSVLRWSNEVKRGVVGGPEIGSRYRCSAIRCDHHRPRGG